MTPGKKPPSHMPRSDVPSPTPGLSDAPAADVRVPVQEWQAAAGQTDGPAFLSVGRFSQVVGQSEKTTLRRIRDGTIRARKLGRAWRIPVSEIGRLLG